MDLKRLIATGALLLTSLIPKSAGSYAVKSADGIDSIHPLLSSQLSAFLSNNSLLPEGITFNLGKVKQGSINEDSSDYYYTRSYNHFISWSNSNDGIWNFPSAKDWAMSSELQSGKIPFNLFPGPLSIFYQSLYPEDNPNYPHDDNSWPRVVEQYQGGEIGTAFGHIFHLICDATVPAHARLDPHYGEFPFLEQLIEGSELHSLWPTDLMEVWTDEHKFEIMNQLTPKSENVPSPGSLPELFEDLAYFTGSNFYSDNSVDGTVVGLTEVMEGNKKYFVKEVEGKKVHVLREGFLTDFPDTTCLQDMWKVLGTKSLEYGAAALNLLAEDQPVEPPECTNECDYGQTTCKDNNVMTCTNNDLDDCREWTPAVLCGSGQVCKDGDCVEEGTDCISHDYQDCGSSTAINWFDSCGNIEEVVKNCTGGYYCSNGNCVTEGDKCSLDSCIKIIGATPSEKCDTGCELFIIDHPVISGWYVGGCLKTCNTNNDCNQYLSLTCQYNPIDEDSTKVCLPTDGDPNCKAGFSSIHNDLCVKNNNPQLSALANLSNASNYFCYSDECPAISCPLPP
ncbi:MAG TPA: hypothetical protein VJA23_02755 [Candidatus Nanoarchaeia archaeon]|nr:hypothetical protein [Candidatus Nanoarchaeia archaeon]